MHPKVQSMDNLLRRTILHLVIALAVMAGPSAQAQSREQAVPGSISEIVNPEKAKPRFFIRNESRERKDKTHVNLTEALYDLPLTDKLVLTTQLPYVISLTPGGPSSQGVGDITSILAYRYHRQSGTSYFAALEARWNTAEDRRLGGGNTLVAPTWFGQIDVPRYNMILFPMVQTFFSVSRDDGRQEINYTVLKGRFLSKLPNRYYLFVEPLVYFDHVVDNETAGTLDVEFGRFVNNQTMLYARPGAGLWGRDRSPFLFEWNFEIGYRYFFI